MVATLAVPKAAVVVIVALVASAPIVGVTVALNAGAAPIVGFAIVAVAAIVVTAVAAARCFISTVDAVVTFNVDVVVALSVVIDALLLVLPLSPLMVQLM